MTEEETEEEAAEWVRVHTKELLARMPVHSVDDWRPSKKDRPSVERVYARIAELKEATDKEAADTASQ